VQQRLRKELQMFEAAGRVTAKTQDADVLAEHARRRWQELLAEESGLPLDEVEEITSHPVGLSELL
jgi:hypothetical protein